MSFLVGPWASTPTFGERRTLQAGETELGKCAACCRQQHPGSLVLLKLATCLDLVHCCYKARPCCLPACLAFRCGPLPASYPQSHILHLPSPTSRVLGLIVPPSLFYLMIGVGFSSSLGHANPVAVVTKHNVFGRSRVTVRLPPLLNKLDAFMHP